METNLSRNEKVIATVAFSAIAVFFVMFMKVNGKTNHPHSQTETESDINYKMGRLEETYSEYSLEGREVEFTYEGIPQKNKKSDAKNDKLDQKKKELLAKQKAEDKKKEEQKKKQSQHSTQVAEVAAQQKLQEKAASVEAKRESTIEYDQNTSYSNGYTVASAQPVSAQNENKEEQKSNKKTFAEWQKQFFANPNTDVLGQFIAALKKNEVTEAEYQAMAQDLVNQTDVKYKSLGLMALRSLPSLASLSQLVHLDPAKVSTFQGYIEQSFRAYLLPQNLVILVQALNTQDKKLVVKSLNLLNVNLGKLSQGDVSGIVDPRNVRDDNVTSLSMSTYRTLLPALTRLTSSQDQELAGLAQQVATLIQSSNNVAVN